jgi:hypothetical protein
MKFRFLPILIFASCASLTPSQKTALADVESVAFAAGTGYLTGGEAGAIVGGGTVLVSKLQSASLGVRSVEQPNATVAPSTSQLVQAISAVSGDPAVAKALGPKIAPAVQAAVASGTPPAQALEKAAVGLDVAAASTGKPSA